MLARCLSAWFLLLLSLLALPLFAADPPAAPKPPYERLLKGEDAKKAADLDAKMYDQWRAANFAGALKAAQEILAIRLKLQGADHWETVNARWNVEFFRRILKHNAEQQKEIAEAYALWAEADQLEKKARFREARPLREKIQQVFRKFLGDDNPLTATSYNKLWFNLEAQGLYAAAQTANQKALDIRRKVLGEQHPQTAQSYNNVAYNLYAQGKYADAEPFYQKALDIRRKVLGEQHPDTATNYNNVAYNLNAQGKYVEAEAFLLKAADSFVAARKMVAASGLERATFASERSPLSALAAVLARNGKPREAWGRFEQNLARGTWDDFSARQRRPAAERDRQTAFEAQLNRLDRLIEQTFKDKETSEASPQTN